MGVRTVGPINSGAAAGSAGSATANANTTIRVSGRVLGVYVKYNDSPPGATTDVLITTKGTTPSAPSQTILSKSNAATDAWFYPEVQANLNSDGSAISGVYGPVPVDDLINVKIDGANAADNIDVWLLIEDD